VKKFIAGFVVLTMITVMVVACGGSSGGGGSTSVHMNDANFMQPSVTISKGSSLNLIDDSAVVHIIQNGSWHNSNPEPANEPGAPTVNVQFQGSDSHMVGPFNTAGTYHLYCTIHTSMNLTVVVQ